MDGLELDSLRERVAAGVASGDERDRLARLLVEALRGAGEQPERVRVLLAELRELATVGPERTGCVNALAGALLDAQIRAYARRDLAEAWGRVDELRARLLHGAAPDLLHDRLAAALFNAYRGGELAGDEATRLAALEELRTRARLDPSADASRVALAELLADRQVDASRRGDFTRAERARRELDELGDRDGVAAIARHRARGLREQLQARLGEGRGGATREQAIAAGEFEQLRALAERYPGDLELAGQLMRALLHLHRWANARPDEDGRRYLELAEAVVDDLAGTGVTRPAPSSSRRVGPGEPRLSTELQRDHLRMLLAAHAHAGDRREFDRAAVLLARARERVEAAGRPRAMLELLAQMLVNALVDANAQASAAEAAVGAAEAGPGAEGLLAELRELARDDPEASGLQLHLATALFNAHAASGRQGSGRSSEVLAELEALVTRAPERLALRRRLVMALVNHHGDALEAQDGPGASTALARLRELVRSPDADEHMRVQLAMALGNGLAHAEQGAGTGERDGLVAELRMLAARPDASEALRTLVLEELSSRFAPPQ